MKPRRKRLIFVLAGLGGIAVAAGLILNAFRDNMVFFYSPSDVLVAKKAPQGKSFRLGGLVQKGSLQHQGNGLTVRFVVTDLAQSMPVTYTGILPDLFKEGQGMVAQGKLGPDGVFHADEVLAKHDEKYMPPEVAKTLKKTPQDANGAAMNTVQGGSNR